MSGRKADIGNKDIYILVVILYSLHLTPLLLKVVLHYARSHLVYLCLTVQLKSIYILCIGCRRVMFANMFRCMVFNATINNN